MKIMAENNEMLVTLKDVIARLGDLGIEYMVTGSFAMSAYATARTTMDIDVILEISSSDADRFEKKFAGDYYVDAISIRRASERQSMFNILSNVTGIKVDCIIRKKNEFEAGKFARRRPAKIEGIEFWVIGKEDLILSKLSWAKDSHSEIQFRDVRNLLEGGVDQGFIEDMLERQGLDEVWRAYTEWKIRAAK
jgi:hypothetical protein